MFTILIIFTGIVAIIAIFIQLAVMNEYAMTGKDITTLEGRREVLKKENWELKDEIARVQSIEYIASKSENFKEYIPIDQKEVKYLKIDK